MLLGCTTDSPGEIYIKTTFLLVSRALREGKLLRRSPEMHPSLEMCRKPKERVEILVVENKAAQIPS